MLGCYDLLVTTRGDYEEDFPEDAPVSDLETMTDVGTIWTKPDHSFYPYTHCYQTIQLLTPFFL